MWGLILALVVGGGLGIWSGLRMRRNIARSASASAAALAAKGRATANVPASELGDFLTTLRAGSVDFDTSVLQIPPIALKSGEQLALVCYEVVLREPRTVSQGVYGGPRVRLAKNLSFNLGGFRAAPHEELHDIDSGDLVLTSKRLIFMGSKRTVNANLSQVIGVEPYTDAVAIHRSNKQRTEYFCNLNRQQISYGPDAAQMTLLSGAVVACCIEGLIVRSEAAPRPAQPRPLTAGTEGAQPRPLTAGTEGAQPRSAADELTKLAKLRDSGVLTNEEFAKLKAELIG